MTSNSGERQSWIQVGTDRVLKRGENLVIDSVCEMEYWEPTEFRRTQIIYDDIVYFITDKKERKGKRWSYHLKEWPENLNDMAGHVFEYDEFFVEERDLIKGIVKKRKMGRGVYFVFYPLIGFLNAKTKKKLCHKYELCPLTATKASLLFSLISAIGLFCFTMIPGLPGSDLIFCFVLLILVDLIFRFSQTMCSSQDQYGFLEWSYSWMFRKK